MDQQRTVSKLMLNIEEFGLDVRTALEQAYVAGYNQMRKDHGAKHKRPVIQYDIKGVIMKEYDCQLTAAKKVGYTDRSISRALKTGRKTRAGHYWKHKEPKK